MKRPYAEFVFPKSIREAARSPDPVGFLLDLNEKVELSPQDKQYGKALSFALLEILEGRARHLFVDRGLFDWVVDHALDIDPPKEWVESFMQLRTENGKHEAYAPVVVHVSGGESPCFAVLLQENLSPVICPSMRGYDSDEPKFLKDSEQVHTRGRAFVRGLSIYTKCFPNALQPGVPEDLKHAPRYNKNAAQHLGKAEEISGGGVVSPHFRNGHFRMLRSEHWTHKRGQVVFVSECFVKGRAERVENFVEKVS